MTASVSFLSVSIVSVACSGILRCSLGTITFEPSLSFIYCLTTLFDNGGPVSLWFSLQGRQVSSQFQGPLLLLGGSSHRCPPGWSLPSPRSNFCHTKCLDFWTVSVSHQFLFLLTLHHWSQPYDGLCLLTLFSLWEHIVSSRTHLPLAFINISFHNKIS